MQPETTTNPEPTTRPTHQKLTQPSNANVKFQVEQQQNERKKIGNLIFVNFGPLALSVSQAKNTQICVTTNCSEIPLQKNVWD